MAKLTAAERNALPDSAFAGPGRTYPVEDKAHAQNAKARAAQHASPLLEKRIDAKANAVLAHPSAAHAMRHNITGRSLHEIASGQ